MKIPNKIEIGGHIYSVVFTDSKNLERDNWGRTFLEEKKILIDKILPQSQIEETFIHELLRICMHQAKLNYDMEDKIQLSEEQIVSRIAPILHEVIVRNKLFN